MREFCYSQIADREAAHARAATFYLGALPETPHSARVMLRRSLQHGVTSESAGVRPRGRAHQCLARTLLDGGNFEELMFIIDNSTEIFSESERQQLHERFCLDRARILSAWGESEEAISIVTRFVSDASAAPLMREAYDSCDGSH